MLPIMTQQRAGVVRSLLYRAGLSLGLVALMVLLALIGSSRVSGLALTQSGSVPVFLTPSSATVSANDTIVLSIMFDAPTTAPVGGAQVFLDFDPNLLQVVDANGNPVTTISPGSVFEPNGTWSDVLQNSVDNDTGQVNFAGGKGLAGTNATGPSVLATVRFKGLSPTSSTSVIFSTEGLRKTKVMSGFSNVVGTTTGATLAVSSSDVEPPSADADPSLILHEDPANGANGFKVGISRVFDPSTDSDVAVSLGSFQAQLTYDGNCVNILGVREMDIPIANRNIDNDAGVATFEGSDGSGVPWPTDLGHALTRLTGRATQQCQVDLELTSLSDVDGNPIAAPTMLSQTVQRGDARADGNITIADALFIAQHLVGLRAECTDTADTNCLHPVNAASVRNDGALDEKTIADALFIAQHLVELRDEFYNLVP